MPFDQFVERALYDTAAGFYTGGGQAGGRRGDFVTSVEVGPLFAAVVGDWLDEQWHRAGRPAEFRVAEIGAGVGTLYRGLRRSEPRCFTALRYWLIEQSTGLRNEHRKLPDGNWSSADVLPKQQYHVVLANELLDNLAFGIAELTDRGWFELAVAEDLSFTVADRPASAVDELGIRAAVGARVPLALAAGQWVQEASEIADTVLAFDYGARTQELAERGMNGWLRTFRGHERGDDPFVEIGQRDITHDVPVDQLPGTPSIRSQAEWLHLAGLDRRVEAAKQLWAERAHVGDLEAMVARSAVNEAKALIDPTGLGSFLVLEWTS